jgi:hypothetical protein
MQRGRKKLLTGLKIPVVLAPSWKNENETENDPHNRSELQTLFMVVAGQSYGVACANETS